MSKYILFSIYSLLLWTREIITVPITSSSNLSAPTTVTFTARKDWVTETTKVIRNTSIRSLKILMEPRAGFAIVGHIYLTESVDKAGAWDEYDNPWAPPACSSAGTVVSTWLRTWLVLTDRDHLSIGYGVSTDSFAGFTSSTCGETSCVSKHFR